MGQVQNKYHVSKNGKVYRVNEDGSFTELGNAEDLNKTKLKPQKSEITKAKSSKSLWAILSLAIIVIIALSIFAFFSYNNSYNNYNNESSSDSTSYEVISNEVAEENPDFDEWREHALNYIQELINSPSKSHYDSSNYSASDSRINAAIDLFYDDNNNNRYAEVEEQMFYPAYRQNNSIAQYYLGCIYENGSRGITQDSKTAFYWFEKAANNGHVKSMYYLARDYFKDRENKRYWMQKAADNGDMEARYFGMAHSYEDGTFTEINLHKALQLYEEFARDYGDDYWLVGEDIARVKSKLGIK